MRAALGGRLDRSLTPAFAVGGLIALWAVLNAVLPRGLPFGIVVLGAVFGSLYALIAVGLVLVYRANRVVNFAQAELGAVAAVLAIELVIQYRVNYFLAIAVGLIGAAITGVIVDLLVIRVFRVAPRLILAVATIGVAQILNGLAVQIPLWFTGGATGFHAERFGTPFDMTFRIAPVTFHGDHFLTMLAVPVVLAGLTYFLRLTDYGVAIRASAENGDRANLLGIPVRRLSTIVWGIAAFLSAVAVILRIPMVGFVSFISVSGGGYSLLLRTLAAAMIGRMESLPVTAAAAIGLGIFEACSVWTFANGTYSDAMLVAVILLALLAQRGRFSRAAETGITTWRALREIRPIPTELRRLPEVRWGLAGMWVLLGGLVLAYPIFAPPSKEQLAALMLIYSMVAVSLVVLTGWVGQISLGQWALVGFGGATTAVLVGRHGVDLFVAIPTGMIVAAVVALLIGLPALRITGPFLAVTTLAFAVTSFTFFLKHDYFPWFVQDRMRRPALWGRLSLEADWQFYYFSLAVLVLVILAVHNIRRSRTGRALVATRDNEPAAQAAALNTTWLKLGAFAIAGAIAGLAGGLYVLHQHGLNTDSFGPEVSLRLFSMAVIGGLGSLPGAILGAVYVRSAEFFLPRGWALIASGAGMVLLLLLLPGGLGQGVYRVRDYLLRLVAKRRGIVVPSLVADVLAVSATDEEKEVPLALTTALGGLSVSGNGGAPERPKAGRR